MPFDRAGKWRTPTAEDVENFKEAVNSASDDTVRPIEPTAELVSAIAAQEPSMASGDFFGAVSQIKGGVDIVIPVYGGLHVLKECVRTIEERTSWDYNLIFVDDCSLDPEINNYLVNELMDYLVITNKKNRGFAATVNRGVAAGTNPYVVILNSDVLVTENWLTKMLIAMESDPRNVMVNPVTNNTAMVNVEMYPGTNYLDMNAALEKHGQVRYPEIMPTGFCMMIRRSIWEEVGPFDEAFGSYGEESDWWFRAIKATDEGGFMKGYRAVLADNCYLFHERGTSFSQLGERTHMQQRQIGSKRFHQLHPDYSEWVKGFNIHDAIGHLRNKIPRQAFNREHKGNVAWAVKSTGACGGMYYIADVANQLIEEGYNVKICLIPDNPETEMGHEIVGNLHCRPLKFQSTQDFVNRFEDTVFSEGILFSAVTELAIACQGIGDNNSKIKVMNHVQSWDVDLAKEVNRPELIKMIEEQYRSIPNVATSDWIEENIRAVGGEVVKTIYPGVDTDLFHNRERHENGDERKTFAIPLHRGYPFKGYDRGVEVARALLQLAKDTDQEIRVLAIGVDSVPEVPGVTALGMMSQAKMADFLGSEVDVLIDPSFSHSYGLPGLEALVSGARYVCWDNGGVHTYANDFDQSRIDILSPDATPMNVASAALCFNEDDYWARVEGSKCAKVQHNRAHSVRSFIEDVIEQRPRAQKREHAYNIQVVSPHMRKHGGPTTLISTANLLGEAGHETSLSMIYTDWNPEVVAGAFVPISTEWQKVSYEVDIVIINSDNPFAEEIMSKNPNPVYIMYKLSHNPRFKEIEEANLHLAWGHIITSTEWLREACLNTTEGWDYPIWSPEEVTTVGWYHYGHPIFDRNPAERIYGNANSGFRLGTLIHGHPLKGTETALSVVAALKRKYEANFHAVGVGEQNAKLPNYIQYFKNCNRLDLAYTFKQLDIWLGASHSEGLGRLALENMSAGVAVVTTNTGAEFLKHEENCLLYEPGDAQAAADAIDRLANDSDLFATIVQNGYKTAVEHANWFEFQTNLLKVLDEVMGNG